MITNFQSMQFFHANQNSPIQTHQTILDTKLLGVLYDRGGEFCNIAFAGFIYQELKLGFAVSATVMPAIKTLSFK